MAFSVDNNSTIIRTERGLTIAGTCMTLYGVMDSRNTEPVVQEDIMYER